MNALVGQFIRYSVWRASICVQWLALRTRWPWCDKCGKDYLWDKAGPKVTWQRWRASAL